MKKKGKFVLFVVGILLVLAFSCSTALADKKTIEFWMLPVIDEAKILAKPIIATAYPTVKDQIQNDNEGIIVELNVNGIVNGIVALCSDNVKKQQITEYLNRQEYGNQEEIMKYIKLFDK